MKFAERTGRLGTETAFEVLAKAKALEAAGNDIIHLEIGEPDFETPQHIKDAAIQALQNGHTNYTPTPGIPEVREVIAQNVNTTRNISINQDQVVITPGAKPIMFFTILALVQQGDEVIYPNPGFPIYESMIRFCEATPVPLPLKSENNYQPDLDELESKINDRTKLIILNSPQNPTGSVIKKEDYISISRMLEDKDIYVLSDEVYKDLLYNDTHFSIATIPSMTNRTIILDGLSKSYAMTGWRLGYGIFPSELTPHIIKLSTNSVSCATSFAQFAIVAALQGPQDSVNKMKHEFLKRRNALSEGMNNIPGIKSNMPDGAFYMFPRIKDTGLSSKEFEHRCLNEAGVALLSGSGFGKYGDGHIRISYANSLENITQAIDRIDTFVRNNTS